MSDSQSKPSRRGFMWGAAIAGAATAAVTTLPKGPAEPAAVAADQAPPAPDGGGGGYHLSEHVRRYYKTTQH